MQTLPTGPLPTIAVTGYDVHQQYDFFLTT